MKKIFENAMNTLYVLLCLVVKKRQNTMNCTDFRPKIGIYLTKATCGCEKVNAKLIAKSVVI
jgi:hypothetical protein